MNPVKITFGFPEEVDFGALPNITTSSIVGTPLTGDVIYFNEEMRFIVEGRVWQITEKGTELHVNLKIASLRN